MNLLIRLIPHSLPAFIREEILGELFEATAEAFGCPAPAHQQLTYHKCLLAYARFTQEQAEKAIQSGQDIEALKARLYANAYPLGEKLRKWFAVDTLEEVMEMGEILYRAIGVEIQGNERGEVTVSRCSFSRFYSGAVCDLISALDDGVFSGLSGGGRLVFSERMTEGKPCCRAKLQVGAGCSEAGCSGAVR